MNTEQYKQKLEEELKVVTGELEKHAHLNHPETNGDWEADAPITEESADENEVADKMEEFEENTAVVSDLEIRFNDIKVALDKIEGGTYGFCEVCNAQIEADRLDANPAARTCKAHMQ